MKMKIKMNIKTKNIKQTLVQQDANDDKHFFAIHARNSF